MKKITLLFIGFLFFVSCVTEEEVNTNTTSELLGNNRLISVLKTEKTATNRGIITDSDYGSTYSFTYEFTVDKNDIIWKNKGSAVPKKILFCKDTAFVKYRQKKSIAYTEVQNDTITITKYRDTIVEKYEAFIDNRYFFKLFGDYFWSTVTESSYKAKKAKCTEYDVPNDNDFELLMEEFVHEEPNN